MKCPGASEWCVKPEDGLQHTILELTLCTPSAYMHAHVHACMLVRSWHTTVTTFMHDLDIACKNVMIIHNSMMHAYASCTCNLISTCTK